MSDIHFLGTFENKTQLSSLSATANCSLQSPVSSPHCLPSHSATKEWNCNLGCPVGVSLSLSTMMI